jgi:hypothetical protein
VSSPQAQQQTLEKVVGAALSGKLNSRADARIKELEPAR